VCLVILGVFKKKFKKLVKSGRSSGVSITQADRDLATSNTKFQDNNWILGEVKQDVLRTETPHIAKIRHFLKGNNKKCWVECRGEDQEDPSSWYTHLVTAAHKET
jgi:hypothetical protein